MRKLFAIALSLVLLLGLAACGQAMPATAQLSFTGITGVWFTEELPGDSVCADGDVLRVGRTYDGKDIFALVRMPLDEELRAEDVREAWLCLKILENNGAMALRAGPVSGPWDADFTQAQAMSLAEDLRGVRQALTPDDWLHIDVTGFVRAWLGGEENHGIVLFEGNGSTETAFAATGENEPKLEIIISK